MMKLTITDKSCLRIVTDAIINPTAKRSCPMGFYFNERVLRAIGRWNTAYLKQADTDVKPIERGYAKKYYCPNCGREMWCTLVDTKQPAITCRKCTSESVLSLFGTPIAERVSWAYTTLLSENYDVLIKGDSTCKNKVCSEWVRDPMTFAGWLVPKVEEVLSNERYTGWPVWLVARGSVWDRQAEITRAKDPRGPRVRIL